MKPEAFSCQGDGGTLTWYHTQVADCNVELSFRFASSKDISDPQSDETLSVLHIRPVGSDNIV